MDFSLEGLADVHRALTEARIELRSAQDTYHEVRLACWLRLINGVSDPKQIGTNAEDRKRAIEANELGQPDYAEALANLRVAEARADRLETEFGILLGARRAQEWAIRDRLASRGMTVPGDDYQL